MSEENIPSENSKKEILNSKQEEVTLAFDFYDKNKLISGYFFHI